MPRRSRTAGLTGKTSLLAENSILLGTGFAMGFVTGKDYG